MRRKGHRREPGSVHGPRGSQGPLGIPSGHPRRWLRFGTFFYWGTCAWNWLTDPRGQSSGFLHSGGVQGSTGLERCGLGVPNGPFGWPHSWFGRGRYFFQNPLLGGEAVDPLKRGSEKKYRPRPNRLWGHPKGPFGTPEPHLSGPVLPWIPPERRKPLVWHLWSVSQF